VETEQPILATAAAAMSAEAHQETAEAVLSYCVTQPITPLRLVQD
jgi:hypothetical protein